ncbi:radical SAM/SPASM domain-containing protein [Novosphingobium naphthalenivorans]|uniref:radical SAM/SPASM domain-containing protein n=1 Tax=Novosphingobium naphthalenivorans TaxID=273168 RepID=UPI00082E6590|nr:radical SAM protein [Novosphingobium naphthalenivorans]
MSAISDARIEQHGELLLVTNPRVGALTTMTDTDLAALHLFDVTDGSLDTLAGYFEGCGVGDPQSHAKGFRDRVVRDGWTRTEFPNAEGPPLLSAYVTITRECNLACPYCYQGLSKRRGRHMSIEQIRTLFDKIAAVNSDCYLILTGGEPLMHPDIYEILDFIDGSNFRLTLLTNGIYIDAKMAERLARMKRLDVVQISLDGLTEDISALSRGKGALTKIQAGIEQAIAAKLPFVLAPTLHGRNLHQINEMAEYAVSNGGYIKPNNLRSFPKDNEKMKPGASDFLEQLDLSERDLMKVARDMDATLVAKYGKERIRALKERYLRYSKCSVDDHNAKGLCGVGWSLLDIDWNGDVFPCHLGKTPELQLGNIFDVDFGDIFEEARERGIRTKSHEISGCSSCNFVSRCAGGCRMGAYYANGGFDKSDDLCHYNYQGNLRRALGQIEKIGEKWHTPA